MMGEHDCCSLEEFTFKTFCDWIRHELEEELRRRWKIKANEVDIPVSQAMVVADQNQPTASPLGGERQLFSRDGKTRMVSSVRGDELGAVYIYSTVAPNSPTNHTESDLFAMFRHRSLGSLGK
jgi:hypothetical protein